MPRFYFDWQDNSGLVQDESGTDLPTVAKARCEAGRALCERAKDVLAASGGGEVLIIVRDEQGNALFTSSLVMRSAIGEDRP